MKKINWSTEQLSEISHIQERDGISRKSAVRKYQKQLKAAAKAQPKAKAVSKPTTDAGKARSAGVQDFILAGRPSREQFVAVFGEAGPRLTWAQRAALGVDAAHFQKALKSGKCVAPVQG